mgnify:CR=1 FL=1
MELDEKIKNAICNNDKDFFANNLNLSIDYRLKDENNDTILLYSISDPKSNLYKYLLNKNANINLVNEENEGILHAIVFSGDNNRLIDVLNKYDLDLNLQSKDGATPLLLYISLEKFDIAKNLIKNGADVNISDFEGISPLHIAAQSDNLEIVEALILKGANIFHKTNNGNLALALAVNNGNKSIIKFLYKLMYKNN